mmetsp:Transcript_12291/g.29811  ORF Transcript_12291/g.29811 Transcript_12291/m.29811 type:complete len:804 (-) Transcript_12291:59-2470(-)|eukprot:g13059.t1
MLTGEATFKLPFTGVNLDRAQVEKLPQPYRFLSKIVDQLFEDVSDKILEIEKRKREQVFEYNLPEIQSTGRIEVSAGRILCCAGCSAGHQDLPPSPESVGGASGSSSSSSTSSYCYQNGLVACGSDSGELLLLDLVRTGKLVCSMQVGTVLGSSPEPVGEEGGEVEGGVSIVAGSGGTGRKEGAVTHVAMTTGFYRRRALCENCTLWRKTSPKIVCAVTGTSDLRVCEFRKPTSDLAPFAKIALSAGNNLTEVLSLHSWAASGALWTCVFVTAPPAAAPAGEQEAAPPAPSEAKILVFRSNLGVPVSSAQERKPFTIEETAETDTEQHGAGGAGTNAAWDSLPESSTVSTPIYVFDQLPGFSVRAVEVPRPRLGSMHLDFFFTCGEAANSGYGRPGSVLLWSEDARLVYFASVPQPADPANARAALVAEDPSVDLTEVPLPPVEESVAPVESSAELFFGRHWLFMDKVSAVGRSASGTVLAVGTQGGVVTMWSGWTATALHPECPGHYGAVKSISFAGNARCCTGGADGWVHILSCESGQLVFRTNTCPSFEPTFGLCNLLSGFIPLAVGVSDMGQLRLWDTRLSQKLGKLVAMEGSFAENTKLFAAYDSFGVFQTQDEHTIISVYDTNVVLQDLFKGISSRLASGNGRLSAGKLFRVLTTEQRMRAPPIAKPPRDQCAPSQSQKSGAGSQRGVQRQPSGTTKSIPGSGASASGGAGRSSKKSPSKRGSSKNALTQATLAAHEVQYDLPAGATRQYDAEPNPQDEKWRKTAIERYRQTLAEKSSARKKINALLEEVTKKIGGS